MLQSTTSGMSDCHSRNFFLASVSFYYYTLNKYKFVRGYDMKNLCLVFICSIFIGCLSFNPSVGIMTFGQIDKRTYQTLEGVMTTESFVVIPIAPKITDQADMGLKIGRILLDGNIIKYTFQAEVYGNRWIFANSIRIKIDDRIYTLEDNNPIRQTLPHNRNYFLEILAFEITPELLAELKSATAFSAELYNRVVNLNERQLQRVKDFLK